jgi:hypothetical protein
MIDEWRECLSGARAEAQTGDAEGLHIAAGMLIRLRQEFPNDWHLPILDHATGEPAHADWLGLATELDAAAVAAANTAFDDLAKRTAQARAAATKSRASKWSHLRDRVAFESADIWRSNSGLSNNAVAQHLLARWASEGRSPLPSERTVRGWLVEIDTE